MAETLRIERNQPTLRELALAKMRDAIVQFQFKPGQRLVERDLCEQLGVSRSVVREVIRHLEAEGLVESLPRGPAVAKPSEDQAAQIYEIRALLEGAAACACAALNSPELAAALDERLALIRAAYSRGEPVEVLAATNEFYRKLFEAAGKTVAWEMERALNARINHLRAMTISTRQRQIEGPLELEKIVAAIRSGNVEAARDACVSHIRNASKVAQALLAGQDKLDQGV
jgi:DNA-binding GntR family transcriptional regulator